MSFEEALRQIEEWADRIHEMYAEEVEPGVSDNSVLEAERDTLDGVLAILSQVKS